MFSKPSINVKHAEPALCVRTSTQMQKWSQPPSHPEAHHDVLGQTSTAVRFWGWSFCNVIITNLWWWGQSLICGLMCLHFMENIQEIKWSCRLTWDLEQKQWNGLDSGPSRPLRCSDQVHYNTELGEHFINIVTPLFPRLSLSVGAVQHNAYMTLI